MVLTKKIYLVLIDDHGYQKIKYPVLTYNHGSQVLSPEDHPFVFFFLGAGSFMKVASNSRRSFKSMEPRKD